MARSLHKLITANVTALAFASCSCRAIHCDALVSFPVPSNVAEAFAGQGKTGPYLLSWSKVVAGSETVWVNSVRFIRGIDYTLDCETGRLDFSRPLTASEMVRVAYMRRGDAAQQSGVASLAGQALVLPLGEFMGAELRLRALSAGSGGSGGGQAVYGLQATREEAGAKLTGEIFLSSLVFCPINI